jgi:hypothetical protein
MMNASAPPRGSIPRPAASSRPHDHLAPGVRSVLWAEHGRVQVPGGESASSTRFSLRSRDPGPATSRVFTESGGMRPSEGLMRVGIQPDERLRSSGLDSDPTVQRSWIPPLGSLHGGVGLSLRLCVFAWEATAPTNASGQPRSRRMAQPAWRWVSSVGFCSCVVDEAHDAPFVGIVALVFGVGPHGDLHAEGVLDQAGVGGELGEQRPGCIAVERRHADLHPNDSRFSNLRWIRANSSVNQLHFARFSA